MSWRISVRPLPTAARLLPAPRKPSEGTKPMLSGIVVTTTV
ncbi:MAG TPA: hypothetical protein VMT37_08690 [Solirubrobacterales bacterium]|nr:hypothetical protein [Solirubrobacterales bacterium]